MHHSRESSSKVLSPEQCLEKARECAAQGAWETEVAFSKDPRHFALLERNESFEVWLLCWEVGNDTGWHDHDGSNVGIHVPRGAVVEMRPTLGGPRERLLQEGQGVCHDGHVIHRMCAVRERGVSIHVYSPPLSRMGAYRVGEDGSIVRVAQNEDEALVHE